MLLVILIIGGFWVITQIGIGPDYRFQPLFLATATPTRTANSYLLEADAYFSAGKVDDPNAIDAIDAYYQALAL